jgi:hypothetical protein
MLMEFLRHQPEQVALRVGRFGHSLPLPGSLLA